LEDDDDDDDDVVVVVDGTFETESLAVDVDSAVADEDEESVPTSISTLSFSLFVVTAILLLSI